MAVGDSAMYRWLVCVWWAFSLEAVEIQAVAMGTPSLFRPVAASDAQGNVIVVRREICSPCVAYTVSAYDATGRLAWRKGVGDSTWPWAVTSAALDAKGRILLAGAANGAGLPLVKPIRSRFEGRSEGYVMWLSPGAEQVVFASYVGGNGQDGVSSAGVDGEGRVVVALATNSSDLTFMSGGPSAIPPTRVNVAAVFRLDPEAGRVIYAVPVFERIEDLTVAKDGSVGLVAAGRAVSLTPEGVRRNIPIALGGTTVAVSNVVAAGDGGYWFAGMAAVGTVPVTPNAWRIPEDGYSYVRWEGSQSITPPGPVRGLNVSSVLVDRANENRLFAATDQGLARSTNNGWTWEIANARPEFRAIQQMASSGDEATGRGRVWVLGATPNGEVLMASDDQGENWKAHRLPPTVAAVRLMAADPGALDVLYLAAGGVLYKTRDGGETWSTYRFAGDIGTLTAEAGRLVLSAVNRGVGGGLTTIDLYWSDDAGESFGRSVGLRAMPQSVGFDPNSPGVLSFLEDGVLTRTSATTFPAMERVGEPGVRLAAFGWQTGLPDVLFGVGENGAGLRSVDGGWTWTPLGTAVSRLHRQLAMGAGGVVHLVGPAAVEGYLGRVNAAGEVTYLSYLGNMEAMNLVLTPSRRLVVVGQIGRGSSWRGEWLRNEALTPLTPPPAGGGPDLLALAVDETGRLIYAVSMAGWGADILYWAGAGADSSVALVTSTLSPDFPGFGPAGLDVSAGAKLVLARIQP